MTKETNVLIRETFYLYLYTYKISILKFFLSTTENTNYSSCLMIPHQGNLSIENWRELATIIQGDELKTWYVKTKTYEMYSLNVISVNGEITQSVCICNRFSIRPCSHKFSYSYRFLPINLSSKHWTSLQFNLRIR